MFITFAAAIYGAYEKRIKNKLLVSLLYFLTVGTFMAVLAFVIFGLATVRQIILGEPDAGLLWLYPLIGFCMGLLFAFFPWLLELKDDKKEKGETK